MMNMCGVLVAPYARPTLPAESSSTGVTVPSFLAPAALVSTELPLWLQIASHTTPLSLYLLKVFFIVGVSTWCLTVTGQLGLYHSSTTTLPLNSASFTSLPVWSL